jgi:tRNA (guanine10-N2)-dimethyltransferase
MLLFILGRQPEIGVAELSAVFGRVELVAGSVAQVDVEEEVARVEFARLGSVMKVARIIGELPDTGATAIRTLMEENFAGVEGKITLGVSVYGDQASAGAAAKIANLVKKALVPKHSVRLVPNQAATLNSAAVSNNNLAGDNPKKRELLFVNEGQKVIVGETIFVQDVDEYTFRDRGRPKRDARVGMLPPKLAQTIVNLARGAQSDSCHPEQSEGSIHERTDSSEQVPQNDNLPPILLDPFCGTGVVLQEAALMGFRTYGTDLEPRMVEYSQTNLDWLAKKYRREVPVKLAVGDATDFQWEQPIDVVATETYLGRPYTEVPDDDNLWENIGNCDFILAKFLKNLVGQVSDTTGICVALPCWLVRGREYHLPLVHQIETLGFERVRYSNSSKKGLVYRREGQVVGRELLVLRKKTI